MIDSVLTDVQQSLWTKMADLPDDFVLIGATAIAYHLQNRPSDGFDFYVYAPYDQRDVVLTMPWLQDASWSVPTLGRFNCLFELEGETIRYQFLRQTEKRFVNPLILEDGIQIASLLDLFAIKLFAVCQRANMKDYLDIDAMIAAGMKLDEGLGAARAMFGNVFDPLSCVKALCSYQDGNLHEVPPSVQNRLITLATRIEEIPELSLAVAST